MRYFQYVVSTQLVTLDTVVLVGVSFRGTQAAPSICTVRSRVPCPYSGVTFMKEVDLPYFALFRKLALLD